MKRRMLGLMVAILSAALILAGCGAKTEQGAQQEPGAQQGSGGQQTASPKLQCNDPLGCFEFGPGEKIKIGYALVLSGPNASLGEDSKHGIEIAIDDMNGQVAGHEIELVGEDEQCVAEGGQSAANKLAADPKIVGIIGTNCSGAAVPAAPIITKAGKVMISPSATSPSLTDPNRGPEFAGFFRTAHNDKVQGSVAAEWAIKVAGFKTAATIHDGDPYTEGLARVFAETFQSLGGTVTNQEAVNKGDNDMKPVLRRIGANRPDIIFFPVFVAEAAFIATQAKEVPGLENTALMTADGAFTPDFVQAAGNAAVGVYHSSPDLKALAGGYQEFLDKHQRKYGAPPPSVFHAHAYDATMLLLKAIEQVAIKGEDGTVLIPQQGLRDALHNIRGYQGLTGTLSCDENGDCADPQIAIYRQTEESLKVVQDPKAWDPGKVPSKVYP